MGIKIRQSGSWQDISGSDSNNTTYEYLLVDYGSSTGSGTGHDSILRLKPSTGTNDDIKLIAGDNVSFGLDTTGGTLTISSSGGGGGSGTLTDVTVDYTGRSTPCALPITISTPSAGTKQINIPANSNAFGAKYVQSAEPTGTSVCDGDIWYDTDGSLKIRHGGVWVDITGTVDTGTTKVAVLWDQKAQNVDGGTFNSGDWKSRLLNQKNDPQSFVTLDSSNGDWSLAAGNYKIRWSAPAHGVERHQTRLLYANNSSFNSSSNVLGSSQQAWDGLVLTQSGEDQEIVEDNRSFGEAVVTVTETTYFKIQHQCSGTRTTTGFGFAANFGNEVYTIVSIEDLATAVKEGSGGGSSTFLGLSDVDPTTYTGQEGKLVKVNSAATGLEFGSSGGGGETYTLPLTHTPTASSYSLAWTLTPESGTGSNAVKMTAGNNITFTEIDTTGPDYEFTVNASLTGGSVDPVGTIVAWSGSISNIPTDEYQLCDGGLASTTALQAITGANVPDLRDKFIVGATDSTGDTTYPGLSPGATGGSSDAVVVQHTHKGKSQTGSASLANGHSVWVNDRVLGNYGAGSGSGGGPLGDREFLDNPTGSVAGTNKNLPPYYSLCYIIKHTAKIVDSTSGTTKVAVIEDQKASGTAGGNFNNAAWRDRDLNTKTDPLSFVTLDSGNDYFSLPAGTYEIGWSAPAVAVDNHQTRLIYATDTGFSAGVNYVYGSSEQSDQNEGPESGGAIVNETRSFGTTVLTTSVITYFKIQHRCATSSVGTNGNTQNWGRGKPSGFPSDGSQVEVYTQVSIEDLATAVKEGSGGGGGATYSLPCSGTSGDGGAAGGSGNATLTLTGSNGTTDPVQITAGSGMVIDEVQDGGFRLSTSNTTSATERVSIVLGELPSGNVFGSIPNPNGWNNRYFTRTIESVSSSPLVSFVTGSNTGNPHNGYSLFSLNAGTYLFKWRVPGYDTGLVRARLSYSTTYSGQNLTGTINYQYGESGQVDTFSEHNEYVNGQTTLTITETTYFKIEYFATTGNYGAANSITNVPEIYSQVRIEDLATAVKEDSGGGGGGGTGLGSRGTNSTATTTISKDASDDISIVTQGKSYGLLKVEIDEPAWVVLYVDSASRTSDSSRSEGTDPAPGAGVIAEVSSTTAGSSTFLMTPGVLGWNNDGTPAETVYAKVTNRRSTSGSNAITVTLTTLKLES